MTSWNAPKLVSLSGAYDSAQKVATGLKEGIAHVKTGVNYSVTSLKANYTTS